jgi:hypothetical protein
VHEHQKIGAVVEGDLRLPVHQRVHVTYIGVDPLAAPGLHRHPVRHQRRRDVVLSGQRVRRAEGDLGAAGDQGVHEVGRLGRDVQARRDLDVRERSLGDEPIPDRAQDRHLTLCPLDSRPTLRGERRVGDVGLSSDSAPA